MDVDAKEGLLRKNDQINGMIFNYHGNQEDKRRQEFNKSFLFDRGIFWVGNKYQRNTKKSLCYLIAVKFSLVC